MQPASTRTPPLPSWLDREAYPFSSRRVPLSRGAMHLVDEGSGPPVVFVHGTPTWSFEYRHLLRALRDSHRVLAPDHLGFGLSERPAGLSYSPEEHSQSFSELMAALALPRVSVVVHDFGGPIALDWVLNHVDQVERLVVLNSWMWSFDDDRAMQRRAALAGSGFGRWLYRHLNFSLRVIAPSAYGDRKRLTPAIHQQYLNVFPDKGSRGDVLWALARSMLGSAAYFDSLWQRRTRLAAVPVELIWGLADSAFPPRYLEKWLEGVPHARAHRLEGVGHWPHEEAPEQVVAWVRDALARPRA